MRSSSVLLFGGVFVAIATITAVIIHQVTGRTELPRYWQAPRIQLTDSTGKLFDSSSLEGKVWIANFFFTRCPGVCPTIHGELQKIYREFSPTQPVRIVSISVDPKNDTQLALEQYASKLGISGDRWTLLAGESATVGELLENGFKLGDGGEPQLHTTRLVLVDQHGMIRGFYHGTEREDVKRLAQDIKTLL